MSKRKDLRVRDGMHLPLMTRIFLVLFQICILTMALPAASMDSIGIEEREVSLFLSFILRLEENVGLD